MSKEMDLDLIKQNSQVSFPAMHLFSPLLSATVEYLFFSLRFL